MTADQFVVALQQLALNVHKLTRFLVPGTVIIDNVPNCARVRIDPEEEVDSPRILPKLSLLGPGFCEVLLIRVN